MTDVKITREEFDQMVNEAAGDAAALRRTVENITDHVRDVFPYDDDAANRENSDSAGYDQAEKVQNFLTGIMNLADEAEGRLNAFIENNGV